MKKLNNLPPVKKINSAGLLNKAEHVSNNFAKVSSVALSIALSCLVIEFSWRIVRDHVCRPFGKNLKKAKEATVIVINSTEKKSSEDSNSNEKAGDVEENSFPNEPVHVKRKK